MEPAHEIPIIDSELKTVKVHNVDALIPSTVNVNLYTDPRIVNPKNIVFVIGGIGQTIDQDPLPFIAETAATLGGKSGIISYPKDLGSDFWQTSEGEYAAFSSAISQTLSDERIENFFIVGFSFGGTKAVNTVATMPPELRSKCLGVLGLGSPESEYIYDNAHFLEMADVTPLGHKVGRRGLIMPFTKVVGQSKSEVTNNSLNVLKNGAIPVFLRGIQEDYIVREQEMLKGENVQVKMVHAENGVRQGFEIHSWAGDLRPVLASEIHAVIASCVK